MEFWLGIIIGLIAGLLIRKNNLKDSLTTGVEELRPAPDTSIEMPKSRPPKSVDSVNILLYFGAFLILCGVGLFVGLSEFSGSMKTFAVLGMASLFYGAGLALYSALARLRPAAIALTAIGLMCLPLTGVAASIYLSHDVSGAFIWFVTSLVSFVLYVFALLRIRQSLMGYLAVFMCISLWLSIVSVIEAPVYLFGWALIVLAMTYVAAVKFWKLWPEIEAPLSVSASVMVPISLLAIIFLGHGTISRTHQGISMMLASAFYALALWGEIKSNLQQSYFALGYVLAPLGALFVASDILDGVWVSCALSTVAILQFIAVLRLQRIHDTWRQTASIVTVLALAGSTIYSLPLFNDDGWATYVWLLLLNTALSLSLAFWQRDRLHMALGLAGVVAMPAVLGFLVAQPDWPKLNIVLVYTALALILLAAGRWVERLKFRDITVIACVASLAAAWLTGLSSPSLATTASLLVGGIAALLAYYEKIPVILYAATLMGVIATGQWLGQQNFDSSAAGLVAFALVGLAYYIAGRLSIAFKMSPAYSGAWVVSGLVTLYMASSLPLLDFRGEFTWMTIWCLALAGGLTSFESYTRQIRTGLYGGAAVVLIAAQMALYKFGVEEVQVFTHLWAVYFASLAWFSHRAGRAVEQKQFIIISLFVLTFPLGVKALAGNGGYGLLLLLESVAILLLGLWARYTLISWWGLAVAVGSVLYQLREFQFFVLALLGVGVIGVGVVLLLRQEKNKK